MNWPKKLDVVSTWQSLWGPLSGTAPLLAGPPSLARAHARQEEVRQAMLDAVAPPAQLLRHAALVRKLLHADSIDALWYLRSDVMAALAGDHGEAAARRTLDALTRKFDGLLPEAAMCSSGADRRRLPRQAPPTVR